MRTPLTPAALVAFVAMAPALLACGGRLRGDSPQSSPSNDAAVCAGSTSACQLPNIDASPSACTECVGAAICQCGNLNPPLDWAPPASCESSNAVCTSTSNPSLPDEPACRVGAVQMANCLASNTHSDCSNLYSAAHPGGVEPLGMEIALFDCAACSQCAGPCAQSPGVAAFCTEVIPGVRPAIR